MFNWLKFKNWGIVKVYKDFENYNAWKKTIDKESININSKYNKFKLSHTLLYDLFLTVNLEEEDEMLPENIKRVKILESLNPLHRYLDEELGFAECLNCEFNQFEDEKGKPTLTYFIVYRFNFNKFSIKWVLKNLILIGIITFFIIKYDLIHKLILWVSNFL